MKKFDFKKWREANGYDTQDKAARVLMFSTDTISRLENGYEPRNIHFIESACALHDCNKKLFDKIIKKHS